MGTVSSAGIFAACVWTLAASGAWAAGGAHVVDDAEVETPGVCHLESWTARLGDGSGLVNLAPACTRKEWPNLEIGGFAQHTWTADEDITALGPALKLALRPVDSGLGIGLAGAAGLNAKDGRLEAATLYAPLTRDLTQSLRTNFNLGWAYTRRAAYEHTLVWGGQLDWTVARGWSVMGEAFGRDHGYPGLQAGVRWTFANDLADLDLLYGHRVDGVSDGVAMLGLTIRNGR